MDILQQLPEPIVPPVPNLVCGYPKTGRTWLRFMLAEGIVDHYNLDLDVDLTNVYSVVPNSGAEVIEGQPDFLTDNNIPRIEMSHASYTEEKHGSANTLFLTRDPRDIMVSHWLHNTKQVMLNTGDLSSFVHEPTTGIEVFLEHLESWAPNLTPEQVVTYEEMHHSPIAALHRVISMFGLPITHEEMQAAVKAGAMESMRKKEIERGIAGHSYDRNDPEARRVRRGKVGGFTDYLSPDDQAFIAQKIHASSRQAQAIIALSGYFMRAV